MAFDPIPRRRLYEEVARRIEDLISSGELAEGDALPAERDLMQQFDVGRPAVREALLSLQQKGLVAVGNGERARVVRPDAGHLIGAVSSAVRVYLQESDGEVQFQAARRLFESAIAREAARIATRPDIDRIERALDENRAARGDAAAFELTDVGFHFEIVKTLGNPLLTGLHTALTEWLAEQRRSSLQVEGAETAATNAHERIFAAIASGDGDAAEAEMQSHLDRVSEFLRFAGGK